jgi:lipid-binding SYLF domain-containing protein
MACSALQNLEVPMKLASRFSLVLLALLIPAVSFAGKSSKKAAKAAAERAKIDAEAQSVLDAVLAKDPGARALKDKAYGWAGFDNTKVAIGLSGSGGEGVAVGPGGRTYMKMGSAGVGLGLGAQHSQMLILFETKDKFDSFVSGGWGGSAGATAAAGDKGANAEATFHEGVAVYVITDKGLMANADVSGTKYWQDKKLN